MNIVVDSCFWIALYDERDKHHVWANDWWNKWQEVNKFLVPYPTMYEFINTRLMRQPKNVLLFKELFCIIEIKLFEYLMSNIKKMRSERHCNHHLVPSVWWI